MIYILAANCIVTEGIARCLLSDFQRGRAYFISKELTGIIKDGIKADEIESHEYSSFLQKLIQEDILIPVPPDEMECFIPLPESFYVPSVIHDAIIEYSGSELLLQCVEQLERLKCKHLEVRILTDENPLQVFKGLSLLMEYALASTFESVSLTIPFAFYDTYMEQFYLLSKNNGKLGAVVVCASPPGFRSPFLFDKVFLIPDKTFSEKNCGNISPLYFAPNLTSYTEGLSHNTCLNRKISIDADGNIKNCPSMRERFGNIADTTLIEAIEKPGFKKYWSITKDQIAVCKDCEFRHICTDCRAYLEDPDDIYSKPLKCGYNPYTCEWDEWSTHPLKQRAIEYYNIATFTN